MSNPDTHSADESPCIASPIEPAEQETENSAALGVETEASVEVQPLPPAVVISVRAEIPLDERVWKITAFLREPFKSTFLERQIDYQDPECLERLKDDIDAFMDNQVNLFLEYHKHIEFCYLAFEQIRHQISDPSTIHNRLGEQERLELSRRIENLEKCLGDRVFEIFSEADRNVAKVRGSLDNAKNAINVEHRRDFSLKEDIQFRRGRIMAIKDDVAPKISARVEPTGILQSITKTASNVLFYKSLVKKERKEKVINVRERMYAEYSAEIMQTDDKLNEYRLEIDRAQDHWKHISKDWLYKFSDVQSILTSPIHVGWEKRLRNSLASVNEVFAQVRTPIRDCFTRLFESPALELRILFKRQVAMFCEKVTSFAYLLTQLHMAQKILHEPHQKPFEEDLNSLSTVILGHLEDFKELYHHYRTRPNPELQATFLNEKTWKFAQDTGNYVQRILRILQNQICSKKSKQALKERQRDDRCYDNWHWQGRPLVLFKETLRVLEWLERAIQTTYELSVAPGAESYNDLALSREEGMGRPIGDGPRVPVGNKFLTFCSLPATVAAAMEKLDSAKEIIRSSHSQKSFQDDVSRLQHVICKRIDMINQFYCPRPDLLDRGERERFLKTETWEFARQTSSLIRNIKSVVATPGPPHVEMPERKDRPHACHNRKQQTLSTASVALQQVEDIVKAIHALCITLGIGNNRPKFCPSDSPKQFYTALNTEILALERFKAGDFTTERRAANVGHFGYLTED